MVSGRCFLCFQAEDGIRDLVRSRGLGDVYKRQVYGGAVTNPINALCEMIASLHDGDRRITIPGFYDCLLYTSDAADERSSVDLGGRRIIKKKNGTDDRAVALVTFKNTKQA